MFSRIYLGMFISVLLAAALSYALYYFSLQGRLRNYEASLSGTMQLISEELQRQPTKSHNRYFELITLLLGADIQSHDRKKWLSQNTRSNVHLPTPGQAINISHLRDKITWLLAVGNKTLIEIRLDHLAEQQFRAQAVLLVSELSRTRPPATTTRPEPPVSDSAYLQTYSAFPVKLSTTQQLALEAQQLSRLKRGSVVVDYPADKDNIFTVYAPVPKSNRVVALGPVPQFENLPLSIVLGMLAITGLVVVAAAYWLVSRLETRLTHMAATVSAFGRGQLQARVKTDGQDAITSLGAKINAMATRIETLLQSQRDITQAVSHELRTPLARIRFRLGLLDEATHDTAITQKTTAIRNDLGELEQLIDEVLEHHKLTQLPDLPMEPVDISALFSRIVQQLQDIYPETTLETDIQSNESLSAHGTSLERMLANLSNNACKHGSGHACLSYKYENGKAVISVDDNGPGIDPQEHRKVFNPFYQLDSSRSKQKSGYGLGLAIVERIVSLHGADITISDSALGGTCFSVFFPTTGEKTREYSA